MHNKTKGLWTISVPDQTKVAMGIDFQIYHQRLEILSEK